MPSGAKIAVQRRSLIHSYYTVFIELKQQSHWTALVRVDRKTKEKRKGSGKTRGGGEHKTTTTATTTLSTAFPTIKADFRIMSASAVRKNMVMVGRTLSQKKKLS